MSEIYLPDKMKTLPYDLIQFLRERSPEDTEDIELVNAAAWMLAGLATHKLLGRGPFDE